MSGSKTWLSFLMLAGVILVCGLGCKWYVELAEQQYADREGVQWDETVLNCTIAGKKYDNLFEYAKSPNGRYWIYVASQLNGDPEAWLYDCKEDTHVQLTDNGYFIESEVCVTNNGDWALSLTETSNSVSKLICNGSVISGANVWHHSLCFLKNKLFFAVYEASTDRTDLSSHLLAVVCRCPRSSARTSPVCLLSMP